MDLFCDPFDPTVRVYTNKINKGLPASIKCYKRGTADFVVRVDADDFVNLIFELLHLLEMNEDVDVVACDHLLIDDKENEIKDVTVRKSQSHGIYLKS